MPLSYLFWGIMIFLLLFGGWSFWNDGTRRWFAPHGNVKPHGTTMFGDRDGLVRLGVFSETVTEFSHSHLRGCHGSLLDVKL